MSGLNVTAEGEDEEEIAASHCELATGPESEVAAQPTGHVYRTSGASRPVDGDPTEPLRFSPRAREVASIIGVRHLLTDLHLLEEIRRGEESASLRLLAVRQERSDRLPLALFESSSIAAELECEKARTEDLASGLEEIRNDIQ